MKNHLPVLAKAFGAAVLCVAGLGACDNNKDQVDPAIDKSIRLMGMSVMTGNIQFNGPIVESEVFADDPVDVSKIVRAVITFNALDHQLCHSNVTATDKSQPVCHAASDFSNKQQRTIRGVLCDGAVAKSNLAYQQLFCRKPQPV